MKLNIAYHADSEIKLKEFPENCIDSCVTDPPYGFSNIVEILSHWVKEEYITPKSGGFMGKEWDSFVPHPGIWKEIFRVLKPGATALVFAGARTQDLMTISLRMAGFHIKDVIMYLYGSGFPKATDISKNIDKMAGKKREVIGQREDILLKQSADIKRGKRKILESFDLGNDQRNNGFKSVSADITKPATPEAELWNGWKSHALKPAYEPIIIAMKPNDGFYANNALKHGVSGLNIEECRVEYDENNVPNNGGYIRKGGNNNNWGDKRIKYEPSPKGRFPANIIHDGSEEVLENFPERKGMSGGGKRKIKSKILPSIQVDKNAEINHLYRNDSGSASRFFYCAKVSPEERGNLKHPTIKPKALIEYLCRLTKTPTGGIILDPFAGTGTTGVVCKIIGRDYILIEKDEDNYNEMVERLNEAKIQKKLF